MTDRELILSLADRLHICSRLLTCAAERLDWDSGRVRELVARLELTLDESLVRLGVDELLQ